MDFMSSLATVYRAPNQYVFNSVHKGLLPEPLMEAYWHLTQCITVHALPFAIRQGQYAALARRYPQVFSLFDSLFLDTGLIAIDDDDVQDTICIERCKCIHVCLFCAMRRNVTGAQCAKLRVDCTQSSASHYICKHCNIPSILQIDMLGRIVHIGDQKVLLSLCCATPIYYHGTGHEFDTVCGAQCVRENQFSKAKSGGVSKAGQVQRSNAGSKIGTQAFVKRSSEPEATRGGCFVCKQRNTVHSFQLLHAATRSMRMYYLCNKHNLNPEIIKQIDDEYDLVLALRCNRRFV